MYFSAAAQKTSTGKLKRFISKILNRDGFKVNEIKITNRDFNRDHFGNEETMNQIMPKKTMLLVFLQTLNLSFISFTAKYVYTSFLSTS